MRNPCNLLIVSCFPSDHQVIERRSLMYCRRLGLRCISSFHQRTRSGRIELSRFNLEEGYASKNERARVVGYSGRVPVLVACECAGGKSNGEVRCEGRVVNNKCRPQDTQPGRSEYTVCFRNV